MKLGLLVVGRLKDSFEAKLCADYIDRAAKLGKSLGVREVDLIEVEAAKSSRSYDSTTLKALEAEAIKSRLLNDDVLMVCDEKGEALTSRQIAQTVERYKDRGISRLVFIVGGAEGLDEQLKARADRLLAFGPQTWPHALVRVMVSEQIYRALSLMAGLPYHRD